MIYTVKDDFDSDPMLVVAPLRGPITQALAADLNHSGHGLTCAGCGKPFSVARKQRGVARINHVEPGAMLVMSTSWLLCGKCVTAIRRDGGVLPEHLVKEAREAAGAALVLAAPVGGEA